MTFTLKLPATFHGSQYHVAAFDRYSMAIRALPMLADSYDSEVQVWQGRDLLARYTNGRVVYEPNAPQVA